jgi:hypothetical protein
MLVDTAYTYKRVNLDRTLLPVFLFLRGVKLRQASRASEDGNKRRGFAGARALP